MERRLFCEISPITYRISSAKCRLIKSIKNRLSLNKLTSEKSEQLMPVTIYKHNSLIRRELGNVDMTLQENKAVNLSITAPKIDKVLIKPGQTFSFWHLAGNCSARKGYKEGLTISSGKPSRGVGGGMCQFTNLIHWMVLHTSMDITEHHHHDQIDLFPDFNRQIPFGTGTSILYNYLDYQFTNHTDITYQIITYVTPKYLCGEIRADKRQNYSHHIVCKNEFFSKEDGGVYRNGEIYRQTIDCVTGNCMEEKLLRRNHAKVYYDTQKLALIDLTK